MLILYSEIRYKVSSFSLEVSCPAVAIKVSESFFVELRVVRGFPVTFQAEELANFEEREA